MNIQNWIVVGLLACLVLRFFYGSSRTRNIVERIEAVEAKLRLVTIQANTVEMNVNRLYLAKEVDEGTANSSFSSEDVEKMRIEVNDINSRLAEQNKAILATALKGSGKAPV